MENSATNHLCKGFWVSYKLSISLKNTYKSHAAQIFMTWPIK